MATISEMHCTSASETRTSRSGIRARSSVDHHGGPVDRLRIRGPKGWLGIRTVNFSSLKTIMLGPLKAIRLEAYGDDMIRGAPLLTQPYGNGGVAYAPRYPNNSTTILQRRAYAKACAALARPVLAHAQDRAKGVYRMVQLVTLLECWFMVYIICSIHSVRQVRNVTHAPQKSSQSRRNQSNSPQQNRIIRSGSLELRM